MKVTVQLASILMGVSCYASTAYVTGGAGQFGTPELSADVFTEIGAEPSLLNGLGWEGEALYDLDTNSDPNLVVIDSLMGAIDSVGATGLAQGSILSAITASSLYALDGVTSNLYSDPGTGAATLVGRHPGFDGRLLGGEMGGVPRKIVPRKIGDRRVVAFQGRMDWGGSGRLRPLQANRLEAGPGLPRLCAICRGADDTI